MSYDIAEHRHRFAVWAAARAAQRGFKATVGNLRLALQSTGIRNTLSLPTTLRCSTVEFDAMHNEWCSAVQSFLIDLGIPGSSYGRAAKLINVYVKATIILGEDRETPLGHHAHPPIDSNLLRALAMSNEIKSPYRRAWARVRWTKLERSTYRELIEQLRDVVSEGAPFWTIESYWQPTDEADEEA
jgi:hypothetical protein